MSDTKDTYRSNWAICDYCDVAVIVERDDDRGLPDESEWDAQPDCPLCDRSLIFGNQDTYTQREGALKQGARLAWAACETALLQAAEALIDGEGPDVAADADDACAEWLKRRAETYGAKARA